MRAGILALGLAAALGARAEVTLYKWTDEAGVVHYSDRPQPGAEEVRVEGIQTVPAPRLPAPAPPPPAAEEVRYQGLRITSPADGSTVRDNAGNVTVSVEVSPALRADLGHRVVLELDGRALGEGTSFSTSDVERGAHLLKATIVDGKGTPLLSASSTFYLHRASSLLRPKKPAR